MFEKYTASPVTTICGILAIIFSVGIVVDSIVHDRPLVNVLLPLIPAFLNGLGNLNAKDAGHDGGNGL